MNGSIVEVKLPRHPQNTSMAATMWRHQMKSSTPAQIQQARAVAGHTQQEADEVVGLSGPSAGRTWRRWEADMGTPSRREMPPGLFELYLLKTEQHPVFELTQHFRVDR
jgi:putative transcriptional regulator